MMLMKYFKIYDDELCPCGSGKTYLECCKNRKDRPVKKSKKPLNIQNQRIIAGNAQFTGIAAGRGVGFTTGLLLLREGLGMRETPIRPHSWH